MPLCSLFYIARFKKFRKIFLKRKQEHIAAFLFSEKKKYFYGSKTPIVKLSL